MNKELKNRIFEIPIDIIKQINHAVVGLNGQHVRGLERAKKLLNDKTVKYGQLKRIIHDINTMDKIKDKLKYDLCGGQQMENWAKQYLKGERDLLSSRKDSKKRADDIGGITGERKNSHLKKHTKSDLSFNVPTNLVKSNSHKTSISPIVDLKLFEEVERIKKLMT